MTLPFNKVISVTDFDHPDLFGWMLAMFPDLCAEGKTKPNGYHRKWWENVMSLRAMAACGVLQPGARILGVGAGQEPLIWYLTRYAEVHATDLYADAGVWSNICPPQMLTSPLKPGYLLWDYEPRRLVVQHMDALDLRYPDGYFDAIFSSSSIEHFSPSLDGIALAASQMGRVLKPGGLLTCSTEVQVEASNVHTIPHAFVFDLEEIKHWIVEPSGCLPVDPLTYEVDEPTLATRMDLDHAISGGGYPHCVMDYHGLAFSSYHLTLRKPANGDDWQPASPVYPPA